MLAIPSSPDERLTAVRRSKFAYVYVRQSSINQVRHHQERTELQYSLVDRAVRLGWPPDRVVVIDEDLGKSGNGQVERGGFQRLIAEIGLGNAGLVVSLDASRLARNNRDWHQLLELCSLFGVVIADGERLYDPCAYHDRLLLGLSGIMSEAELHDVLTTADKLAEAAAATNAVCLFDRGATPTAGRDLDPEGWHSPQAPAMYRTLLLLLYGSGMRIGEALRLVLHEVDLTEEQIITVRDTKFVKTRLVPIGPKLNCELAAHIERRRLLPLSRGQESPLFTTRDGRPWHYVRVISWFQHVRRAAGISCPVGELRPPRLHDSSHGRRAPGDCLVSLRSRRATVAPATRNLPWPHRYTINAALSAHDAGYPRWSQPALCAIRNGGQP
ncbi:recombinase family protein [Mesorhizobium sp.]|uniref:recombinase family protein n=1 Tax=Mesorhizobium sp. TaxID=1871066 RepID=UPI00257BE11C|nr:recombinase family protein [Mesorhizobium sp.]